MPILEIEQIQITKLQHFSTGILSYFLRINKISGQGIANECHVFIDHNLACSENLLTN
jgi:hypothetical protein